MEREMFWIRSRPRFLFLLRLHEESSGSEIDDARLQYAD